MTMRLPKQLLDHPLESFIAAGLLLTLLIGASDGASQNLQQNQSVSACGTHACLITKPAG